MVGRTISHYQIVDKLGEGGMGVVYKARDLELGRLVAIKALNAQALGDDARRKRFLQEARTASALNHPNIITIYEVAHVGGLDCIVMEYVDGQPLQRLLSPQGLPVAEAVDYAIQIAGALCAAHDAGIVHRDVKPANLLVSSSGVVKVADFGLAKLTERACVDDGAATRTLGEATVSGTIVGTVCYMSPEQAQGERLDARSDLFSFGVVLYEMLTGRRPFQGDSQLSILVAILHEKPTAAHIVRADLPPQVERILDRSLQKDRTARYPSAAEMARDLRAFQVELTTRTVRISNLVARLRRPRVGVAAALVLLAVVSTGTWFFHQRGRTRWARDQAIPEIARLASDGKYVAAYDLALQAEKHLGSNPRLTTLWAEVSRTITIRTDPPGAEVSLKEYGAAGQTWRRLGRSPIENIRAPRGIFHWRFSKPGFETIYAARPTFAPFPWDVNLPAAASVPQGMVAIPRQPGVVLQISGLGQWGPLDLDPYFLDQYEVTNREFKRFVDAGGYQDKKYWKEPFVKGGKTLSWGEALKEFRDSTGRPGPSTWEAGTYPVGQDDYPVSGVNWYEAAAYAEFAGKKLPTISHWYVAAEVRLSPQIVPASNFGRQGPARVGQYQGLAPFGSYDMAGNVKEWCSNETGNGKRYILGGAWNEPGYQFADPDARSPLDRSATNGFRCVRYSGPVPETLLAPKPRSVRDYSREKPAGDEVFRAYASLYDYDPADLKATVDAVDDSSPDWRKEKVSFHAAYGDQRVPAYLFLPKNGRPPYQAIVYHPGAEARLVASSAGNLESLTRLDAVIRSGRAVLHPVVQTTYERRLAPTGSPVEVRTRTIQRVQDIRRSFDYLESRADIDHTRLSYSGFSWGAAWGPLMTALEPRIKAAILLDGGFYQGASPPEFDIINFAPRVKAPVLMLNGRYDFTFPLETSQKPMFRLLGTPEAHKRHVVLETAHNVIILRKEAVREILDWLDKYLGPVQR